MWWVYALLSAFFAALTAIFAKIGVTGMNSDLATAIRTVVILFLAWGIVYFRGVINQIGGLTKTNWTFLVLSGVATGLSWIFYFHALKIGKVSQVAPIDKGSVMLTLLLSFIILKEPMTPRVLVACGLIVAGMFVLIIK
jgi:bacterial/archaeal transporter family protein